MRKAEKIQLENFIALLNQVHGEINQAVDAGNYETVLLLL